MTDNDPPASAVLEKLQRLRSLSENLPEEPSSLGEPTLSMVDQALIDSPGIASLDTSAVQLAPRRETPKTVGRYKVVSILGRGGMGMVFKGFDPRLNRAVALKMLLGGAATDPKLVHRFATEGEALARLEHPNIVTVHEAGDWDGIPYLAMKFVPGGTLADNAARLRKNPHACARLMAKVARAVGYLQTQNVSHRDLKPANILLGADDEPMVADFGLAKFHDVDNTTTVTGPDVLLGTRYYMSPEQTRGQNALLTPACDIWGLGVILYELVSGKLPFSSGECSELFRHIRVNNPPPLRDGQGHPQPELEAIVLKAMSKSPGDRYPTATAMAEDLERWLAGMPVEAKPPKSPRTPAVIGAMVAASVLAALLVGAMWKPSGGGQDKPAGVTTLLGVTPATAASLERLEQTKVDLGVDAEGRLTLDGGTGVGIVQLGNASYKQGTRIEAKLRQIKANTTFPSAGIYCLGNFSDGRDKGPLLNFVDLRVKTITATDRKPAIPLPDVTYGSASLNVGRWDPQQDRAGNPQGQAYGTSLLGRTLFLGNLLSGPSQPASVFDLRIDILPSGTVKATIDEKFPLASADDAEINRKFEAVTFRDIGPRMPVPDRFGTGIGLFAEGCVCAFWNVTVQPLPKE